jgi:SOUL heme-binding protein
MRHCRSQNFCPVFNWTSSAFSSLFKYISQGNKSSQKIAMTAPVIAAQKSDNSEDPNWFVSFVMPPGSTFDHMPDPNDSRVTLRELAAETCVAKSFRGKATEELSRKMVQELRMSASKANISLSAETRICRFDPPLKPGFLQYNEIVIPIDLGK